MKNTPNKKFVTIFFLAIIIGTAITSKTCFAWDGIDPKKNSTIQIDAGNLVREGSTIDFYDSLDGNYHTGKVLTMNSVSHATELTIEDFTENHKERFFLMNE